MKKELIKFNVTDKAISEMKIKTANLKVTDNKERADVTVHLVQVKKIRTGVEAKRVELKADALKFGRNVDAEAARIKALLLEIENPLKEMRTKYDAKKEAEKAEKERIEKLRIYTIRSKIEQLKDYPTLAMGKNSEEIAVMVLALDEIKITTDVYSELFTEAKNVKADIQLKLARVLSDQLTKEEEAKRLKEEREAFAEEQRLAKIEKDKQDKIDANLKAEQDKKDKAEAERLAKEDADREAERKAFEKEKADFVAEQLAVTKAELANEPVIEAVENIIEDIKVAEIIKDVVEPVHADVKPETKKIGWETDEAKEALCEIFDSRWHSYINKTLAGDFACELAKKLNK